METRRTSCQPPASPSSFRLVFQFSRCCTTGGRRPIPTCATSGELIQIQHHLIYLPSVAASPPRAIPATASRIHVDDIAVENWYGIDRSSFFLLHDDRPKESTRLFRRDRDLTWYPANLVFMCTMMIIQSI